MSRGALSLGIELYQLFFVVGVHVVFEGIQVGLVLSVGRVQSLNVSLQLLTRRAFSLLKLGFGILLGAQILRNGCQTGQSLGLVGNRTFRTPMTFRTP